MLKRLYKRFLEWALAPVLVDMESRLCDLSMSTTSVQACLSQEIQSVQTSVEEALAEAHSASAKADASLCR